MVMPPLATCRAAGCTREKVRGRGNRYCAKCAPTERAKVKSAANDRWKANNPDADSPENVRKRNLWHRWKMTPESFDELLASQDGKCANQGCSRPPGTRGFHVDHDHACCPGKRSCGQCVRGLLCGPCNRAAGYAHDNATVLRGLADYLER